MKKYLLKLVIGGIMFLFLPGSAAFAQNVVTGKVFPAGMLTPMRDVAVKIQNSDTPAVLTGGDGIFKVEVPKFPATLEFSRDGYQKQLVEVKKPEFFEILLMM